MAGKKILIADDEQDILEVLGKKLRQQGYEIITYAKGKDAFDGSKLHKPDLIILDIAMPEMDGYNVALALREEEVSKSTPIIFMTAKELEYSGIQKRSAEIGYCDFIAKPCVFEDLLAKVKEMMG